MLPALLAFWVHVALGRLLGWPVAALWSAALLYVTLGFRQFSHHFTDIRDALEAGDEDRAREQLARWRQVDLRDQPRSELVRGVIEHSVLQAHRHVFGVLAWYSILAAVGLGPAGAVLYRSAEFVARYWRRQDVTGQQPVSLAVQAAATEAWRLIDWLPSRITALGFAVVGSFEEAIDSWRHQVSRFPDDNDGVILAATAGAINVRLGDRVPKSVTDAFAAGSADPQDVDPVSDAGSPGREPETAHLAQVVGLVWRSVVMWLVLLALLTLARLLG